MVLLHDSNRAQNIGRLKDELVQEKQGHASTQSWYGALLAMVNKWEGNAIDKQVNLKMGITKWDEYTQHVIELKKAQRRAKDETKEAQKKVEEAQKITKVVGFDAEMAKAELDVMAKQLDSTSFYVVAISNFVIHSL